MGWVAFGHHLGEPRFFVGAEDGRVPGGAHSTVPLCSKYDSEHVCDGQRLEPRTCDESHAMFLSDSGELDSLVNFFWA